MKKSFILLTIISLSSTLNANNFHRYIWANYQQFSGNKHQAQQWYELIADAPQQSVFTNKGYLHFLNDHGNYARIMELMPKLEGTFKNDPDIQLIFVVALRKTGKEQEADDKLLRLSHTFKLHPEIVFQATETLVKRKETTNALSLIDDYLNSAPRRPNNFIFHFLKAQIYVNMRDIKQARAHIQQCLDAHPRFPQGWLLLAMMEEQAGQLDQAIKGYSSYLELIGKNQQIERHLLELVFKQKAAQRNQQIVFIDKACLSKSLLLFERKQYQAALQQINNCLEQAPDDTNARLLKIQILTTMRNFDETIATLTAWISQEPDNTAWYQALHLLRRAQVPTVKIINALSTIHRQHANALLPVLYLADLHTKEGEIDQAHSYHQKALALTDNQELKARIMYQLSISHYETGEYTQMLSLLAQIEKMEFSFPPAYNLHAYYCATKGKDLATAQSLCSKAHTGDRCNPHFLDTQAVIFYKQKKYAQAEKLLQALHDNNKTDSSILITLAKTQAKLGNGTQAQASLTLAQQHAKTECEKKKIETLASRWNKQKNA